MNYQLYTKTDKIPAKEIIYSMVSVLLDKLPRITTSEDTARYKVFIKALPKTSKDPFIITRNDL